MVSPELFPPVFQVAPVSLLLAAVDLLDFPLTYRLLDDYGAFPLQGLSPFDLHINKINLIDMNYDRIIASFNNTNHNNSAYILGSRGLLFTTPAKIYPQQVIPIFPLSARMYL